MLTGLMMIFLALLLIKMIPWKKMRRIPPPRKTEKTSDFQRFLWNLCIVEAVIDGDLAILAKPYYGVGHYIRWKGDGSAELLDKNKHIIGQIR